MIFFKFSSPSQANAVGPQKAADPEALKRTANGWNGLEGGDQRPERTVYTTAEKIRNKARRKAGS
jgi:hypothetical protein